MTEQLTSPSNYSLSENALRLNGSSCFVSPSESNFGSDLKCNLVQFEEFKEHQISDEKIVHPNQMGKKKLTIRIDQSYDFEGQNEHTQNKAFQKSQVEYGESVATPMSDFQLISPIQSKEGKKYIQLLQNMQEIENRLNEEIQKNKQNERKLTQKDETIRKLKCQIDEVRYVMRSKQQIINMHNQQNEDLKRRIEEKEEIIKEQQEKLKEKDSKLREMSKMNIKLKDLSKDLLKQVKNKENQVKDLEKQIQKSLCLATQQNINKLKQSSLKLKQSYKDPFKQTSKTNVSHNNKENSFGVNSANIGMRKSLDKKKTGINNNGGSMGQLPQSKRTQRNNSSNSTTILNKKLMHK